MKERMSLFLLLNLSPRGGLMNGTHFSDNKISKKMTGASTNVFESILC
jgi:hypothetical protein